MKKWILAGLFLCLLCGLAGCTEVTAEVDIDDCVDFVQENVAFDDTLEELERDIITWRYGIDDTVDARAFVGSGATAEEFCVMKATDETQAAGVFAALEQHLTDMRDSFADYLPLEVTKIDRAFLKQYGNTVVLVISADTDLEQKMTSYFK